MRKRTFAKRRMRALSALCMSAMWASLLCAGCTEEADLRPASSVAGRALALEMEPATKVSVNDDTGALGWTAGDAIAVRICGTAPDLDEYQTPTVNAEGNKVNVYLEGNQDIKYYSVHPASARVDDKYGNGTELQVKYAASYALPPGSTAEQLKQLNRWSPLPMVAANTEGGVPKSVLQFYHVGGVLRIKLKSVPAGTTSFRVTLEGVSHITGTYKVDSPGTSSSTGTLVTGEGNTVEFTGVPAGQDTLWLNVPIPTGDYASLTAVKVTAVAPAPADDRIVAKSVEWDTPVSHGDGRRLGFDFNEMPGALHSVNIGPTDPVTLWKGEPHRRTAMACDENGLQITSGVTITWSSSDASVAEVDGDGTVTTKAAGSAVLTATATLGGVSKTAEYTVYVNEITGLSLSCGPTMTLRVGTARPVTATATYTTHGTPEVPEVNWVIAPATLATLAADATASGAANTITAGANVGSGTLTVSIPANRYGTNAAQSAMCSFNVLNSNYLPGAFSVGPRDQVYFSKGNLQVNYTNNGGTVTREWLFSENQWDAFYPTAAELQSLPTPAEGTTVKLSHFGWATAGHENPSSPTTSGTHYGYEPDHEYFEPHSILASTSNNEYNCKYGPLQTSFESLMPSSYMVDVDGNPYNTWNWNALLRSYCDWGIHFDDNGVGHDNWYDGSWFTMSNYQWKYLFWNRPGAADKIGRATILVDPVNAVSVPGLVILPDDWQLPAGCTFTAGLGGGATYGFDLNTYEVGTTWDLMEASGAVFMPVSGRRVNVTYFYRVGDPYQSVWITTSTVKGSAYPYTSRCAYLAVYNGSATTHGSYGEVQRDVALSVRLVHYAN